MMGGIGSGRHYRFGDKHVTSNLKSVDIRLWQRKGLISPGQSFNWHWSIDGEPVGSIRVSSKFGQLIFSYSHQVNDQEWQNANYPVQLDWTPCNYGGDRPWFLCPASGCGRRAAILYGGSVFACRHCHDLAYMCQSETQSDRAQRKADKIRERLEWEPGTLNGRGPKPKGMHWSTFQKLILEHDDNVNKTIARFAWHFGLAN